MKRFIFSIAAIFAAVVAFGQTVLPNDPAVKTGKLENGMTYYIRHNDKPAQRAEFYLATNVGAYQEADDQDGLAHFLEHMCFNGTKNFPGKSLLEFLLSFGAEFGRNINAATGFEQTYYMLNNIPVIRESIIDSCLLVMHDYSHFVTCDPAEIDAERGVILEEKRQRSDAQWRMFEASLPYLYGDTHYARRTLIGGEEQLKTFKYESLTNFYKKWYQPDMQAIIVVGDVDVDAVEAKIKSIFSDIPAPAVPTVKEEPKVPGNAEPIVGIITDPEARNSRVDIYWKSEPIPFEFKNTDVALTNDVIMSYISLIMSERIADIASKPDAPFFDAAFMEYQLNNVCNTMNGIVVFKDGDALNAMNAFMMEVEKMKRFGFTEGEVERAKTNIIAAYEQAAEAADTRQNSQLVQPLINNFFDNEPYMEPQMELQLIQMLCSQINADILNQVVAQLCPDQDIVVLYQAPEKEGVSHPTEGQLVEILKNVKNAEIKANVEEAVNEPLISAKLKGSKVKKETEGLYGATEWTLKNGLKVVVLPTQYKQDQVIMKLDLEGGQTLIATEDMPSFEENIWSLFQMNTGVSKFSASTLRKMLAGKQVSVEPYIDVFSHGIQAVTTPKDLETALQLAYLYFADPRFDEAEYQTGIQQIVALLPNLMTNPDFLFQNELNKTIYDNNPRQVVLDAATLEKANLATIERVYRQLFKDVAGATLTVIGNVDIATLKPLVEKYMGSLPKGKKATEINEANLINRADGKIENIVRLDLATPKSTVYQVYTAYMPVDTKTEVVLSAASYVLDMVYTKTLREEEGGTYGASSAMNARRIPNERASIMVAFDTNVEKSPKLRELAIKGLKDLAENGPTQEQLTMALENFKKNLPEQKINNSYWLSALEANKQYGIDYNAEYEAALDAITIEDVKSVLQQVLASGNFMEIVLMPKN